MNPMSNDEVYQTSDQGLAAYLMERGFYCVRAVPAGDPRFPEKKLLVFIDVPDPKQVEDDYFRYRTENMSARSYFEKVRSVRHIIRNGLSEADVENIKRG